MSILTTVFRAAAQDPDLCRDLIREIRAAGARQYVALSELPQSLQKALASIGYRRKEVDVQQATEFRPSDASAGFTGNRGFMILVDLVSGQTKTFQGSFGGPNPFTKTVVDDDDRKNPIPPNHAVIQGESGGRGTFAHIKIHPSNFAAMMMEGPKAELTKEEQTALNIIATMITRGRIDEFQRSRLGQYGPTNPLVQRLAELGLVKIQGKAVSVTTAGRNLAKTHY